MEAGIYFGLSFDEYHEIDAVSNSRMALARRSLAHYARGWRKDQDSPALRFGSLAHCGVLEPAALAMRYLPIPDFHLDAENRRKDGKASGNRQTSYVRGKLAELARENPEKKLVSREEWDEMAGLVSAIERHALAFDLLGGTSPAEVSLIWVDAETGLLCKGRVDKWQGAARRFADLKTCRDALRFGESIREFGYYRQAAFYQEGIRALTGETHEPWLVAIEKTEPWGIRAAPVGESWLEIGRVEIRETLRLIREAKESGKYPGYTSPDAWEPPPYLVREYVGPVELFVKGERVTV